MPLKVEYLDGRRGIFSEASGQLTGAELLLAMADVNSPALTNAPILYTFFDFNGVTGLDITTAQVRRAAELSIKAARNQSVGRVVAIYANDDLQFALARMWQILADYTGWDTRVFRDRADAAVWVRQLVALKFGIQAAI